MPLSYEEQFEEIRQLSLIPLEAFLDGRSTSVEKSAFTKVSGLVFTLAKHDHSLYTFLVKHIEAYYARIMTTSLRNLQDEDLLREFIRHGENQETIGRFYRNQFEYLSRHYFKRTKCKTFEEIARSSFQKIIYEETNHSIIRILLDLIKAHREGAIIDKLLIKDTVRFISTLGSRILQCYEDDFERLFLKESKDYYHQKSQQWLENDSVPVFLTKCDQILQREKDFVLRYLHPITDVKLQHLLEKELLQNKVVLLLERETTGFKFILEQQRLPEIALFYKFVLRVGQGMEEMTRIFREFIEQEGRKLWQQRINQEQSLGKEATGGSSNSSNNKPPTTSTSDGTEDSEMILSIFQLYDYIISIVRLQVNQHPKFQDALKRGFESIVNFAPGPGTLKHTFIEILVNFCDGLLKKTSSSMKRKYSEKEREKYLENIVQLLIFLQDKDIFRNEYQKAFAERLLNQTSASDDLETFVISKLKMAYGQEFTRNLEIMMFDMGHSIQQNTLYQQYLRERGKSGSNNAIDEFSVQVITIGHWPTYQKFDRLMLPLPMQQAMRSFQHYYTDKHTGKKLAWIHELGQVTIQATWPGQTKAYNIQTIPLQAAVLMLFNDHPPSSGLSHVQIDNSNNTHSNKKTIAWTFQEIVEQTNLDADIVRRVLDSLCFSKNKLLSRDRPISEGRTSKNEDSFTVNMAFTSKLYAFRMLMPSLTVVKTHQHLDKDREHVIEASIVRIMKARKTMLHSNLMSEVLAQLQWFRPEAATVKKRIESLIEREFLERDVDNRSMYKYLA